MKILFNGQEAYIDWNHTVATPKGKYTRRGEPVIERTVCILRDRDSRVLLTAMVSKNPKDAPNRRLARKFSLKKLMYNLVALSKEEKSQIWDAFFALTPKNRI